MDTAKFWSQCTGLFMTFDLHMDSGTMAKNVTYIDNILSSLKLKHLSLPHHRRDIVLNRVARLNSVVGGHVYNFKVLLH